MPENPLPSSIRNSQHQLLNMLDSIAEGIYCVDMHGICTYCNRRCVELLGYGSEDEIIGQNMHDLIHYQHRDGSLYDVQNCKLFRAYAAGANVHTDDEVFWRKDKTRFDTEYWSFPLKDGSRIVGAVVSFLDVTLKRQETAYRNHLARLVETSHDAIISKDLRGVITSWNQGAEEIYGYDAETMIGQTTRLLLPPGQEAEESELQHALRAGIELPQFPVRRKRSNGEICDLVITLSPLFNSDDELIGCSSIERDVSDARRSQDAVLQAISSAEHAEQMAEKANRSRTEFLANVSHELRTPMNAILGMINLSLDEELHPVVADYLSVAKTSADSLLELVNELLDFAKLESGKFEIANEAFDIREVVDVPAKVMSSRASEKGLEILCEVDSNIPSQLIGDGRRIQQVLTNLISNAVKFTDRGEVVTRIDLVRTLPSEVRLRFSVSDTGIGIAPDDQANVMLPFQQADMTSTRRHHGTGLGLSICRELVALMGGMLKVDSKVGQGSRFYFHLSLPVADDSQPAHELPVDLVQGNRVLIVDDNPTNLRILEKIFVSWSMQPIVSTSAQQAIRVLDELAQNDQSISLAIIDSLMPQVDGFELAEMLSSRQGDDCPPIVMMQSAADMGMYSERESDAPVAHYLTKPVSQSELLNAVVEALDLYGREFERCRRSGVTPSAEAPIMPLNILLVEDLPANQKVAKTILENRGHRVAIASNGRVAVDTVQSSTHRIDVILMDVQMPVMDGLQATAAIRALANLDISETPIIAMTAHAMQGDREACLAAGMDAYISKPLDAKRLIGTVESIAQNPEVTQSLESNPTEAKQASAGPRRGPQPSSAVATDVRQIEGEQVTSDSESSSGDTEAGSDPELVEIENALLRLGGDRELFDEFVQIFLADSPAILQNIMSAVDNEDPMALEKSAHALKGLMSNFGAKRCCDVALQLELAGRNQQANAGKEHFDELRRLYDQLCRELVALS